MMLEGTDYSLSRTKHEREVDISVVKASLKKLRDAGVSYFRDGGDPLGVSIAARNLASDYGIDFVTPAFAIHKKGRYGSIVGRAFSDMNEFRLRVAEVRQEGGDFIKIMASGIITFRQYGELSCECLTPQEICEMIRIAHGEGFAVMTHVNGAEAIRAVAESGGESVEHGYFADGEALSAMAENGTIWVPTLSAVSAFVGRDGIDASVAEETVERQKEALRIGARMGIRIAAGSDSGAVGVPHGAGTLREYELLSECGLQAESLLSANETISKVFRIKE